MYATDVIRRLKEELGLPNFLGAVGEKEYSEAEYQQIKLDLLKYYEEYVGNIEGYFPGLDMIEQN